MTVIGHKTGDVVPEEVVLELSTTDTSVLWEFLIRTNRGSPDLISSQAGCKDQNEALPHLQTGTLGLYSTAPCTWSGFLNINSYSHRQSLLFNSE